MPAIEHPERNGMTGPEARGGRTVSREVPVFFWMILTRRPEILRSELLATFFADGAHPLKKVKPDCRGLISLPSSYLPGAKVKSHVGPSVWADASSQTRQAEPGRPKLVSRESTWESMGCLDLDLGCSECHEDWTFARFSATASPRLN